MKLALMSLFAAVFATSTLEIVGRSYGLSAAPVLWLFLPKWIFVPNFLGVFVGLFVQASVGWSGWLSSSASSWILCVLGNWLSYFVLANLVIFLKGKISQAALFNRLRAPHTPD